MSGYVSKRVANTRTAMGTTDQKPQGTGSVMLGLAGGIGSSNWSKRVNKRKSYSSMLKKECGEGNKASCINPTKPPVEAAHNHEDNANDQGGDDWSGGVMSVVANGGNQEEEEGQEEEEEEEEG